MKKYLITLFCVFSFLFSSCSQAPAAPETVQIDIKGMTCQDCVEGITGAVTQLPGVNSCTVSLENESAVIEFQSGKLSPEQLQKRINQLGFQASITP